MSAARSLWRALAATLQVAAMVALLISGSGHAHARAQAHAHADAQAHADAGLGDRGSAAAGVNVGVPDAAGKPAAQAGHRDRGIGCPSQEPGASGDHADTR